MTDVKSWIQSRTIWAILLVLAPIITKLVGIDIEATMADVLTLVGAAAAIYFRFTAKAALK
jgi:hypothetical protein